MFKINKRNTFNYIISSILIFSIFTSNTAYAEIYFSEDSRQGIERLESIQDVDLDIYLDVGVHNELWQHIVEQLVHRRT